MSQLSLFNCSLQMLAFNAPAWLSHCSFSCSRAVYRYTPVWYVMPMWYYPYGYGYYGHHHYYGGHNNYDPCKRASSSQEVACHQEFTQPCSNVSGVYSEKSPSCLVKVGSALTRDDLMTAAFSLQGVRFPLNLTIHKVSATFTTPPKGDWDLPLFLSISEVEVDTDDSFAGWIILVICLSVALVVCACCCCICNLRDFVCEDCMSCVGTALATIFCCPCVVVGAICAAICAAANRGKKDHQPEPELERQNSFGRTLSGALDAISRSSSNDYNQLNDDTIWICAQCSLQNQGTDVCAACGASRLDNSVSSMPAGDPNYIARQGSSSEVAIAMPIGTSIEMKSTDCGYPVQGYATETGAFDASIPPPPPTYSVDGTIATPAEGHQYMYPAGYDKELTGKQA